MPLSEKLKKTDCYARLHSGGDKFKKAAMDSSLQKQPDTQMVKMAWEGTRIGRRPLGRHQISCSDQSGPKDHWTECDPSLMEDRQQRRPIVQSAKAHPGL